MDFGNYEGLGTDPPRYQGTTEFLVNEKLYVDFGLCKRLSSPHPHVVQGSTIQDVFHFI